MDSTTIAQMIRAGLPHAEVEVSGDDGVHFDRLVYATLGELMGNEIHALGLRTELPE